LFAHDLRANAFAFVARENPLHTFPDHALLHRIQPKGVAILPEPAHPCRVGSVYSPRILNGERLVSSRRRMSTMRWKIRSGGHDPRQIDLLAVLAIVVLIVAIDHYLTEKPKPHVTSAFIEPSQNVRW
jgi:hypothetical protein